MDRLLIILKTRNILKRLSKIGLTIVPLMLLLFAVGGRIAGFYPFVVMSGSMEPSIAVGSVCFVNTKIGYNEIETGDIIAYKTFGNLMVTHRVSRVVPEGLITKGDANDTEDGSVVTKENYVGKTVGAVPGAGYIVAYIKHPLNLIVSIILIYGLNVYFRHIMF